MDFLTRKPLLLCVDDEKPALTIRKMVLEKNGFDVVTATNSVEALEVFRTHAISLVMADHLLGHESGLELAAALKRLNPFIPIVLLSGLPPDSMDNLDCFICKGEGPSHVISILRDLLSR